jgi:hypothetical protein
MRPGKYDRKHQLLITGAELRELKELDLAESFGLDRRIERYEGKRPLGLYRWDLECLVESLSMVLDGRYYGELPPKRRGRRCSACMIGYAPSMTPRMGKIGTSAGKSQLNSTRCSGETWRRRWRKDDGNREPRWAMERGVHGFHRCFSGGHKIENLVRIAGTQ